MELSIIKDNSGERFLFGTKYNVINETNGALIGVIGLSGNQLEYIETKDPGQGYGYEIVKALLKDKKQLSIWHPIMRHKGFWLSVIKKLKKEMNLQNIKFDKGIKVEDKPQRLKFIYSVIQDAKNLKDFSDKDLRKINYDLQYIVFCGYESKEKLIKEIQTYFNDMGITSIDIDENRIDFCYYCGTNHAFSGIEMKAN